MSLSPIQVKERLLRGLDEENNVVDNNIVWEAIGFLEKLVLTREDLEQTRLGKYVNDLRKKTADQNLSKKCKKLVRSWQQVASNASPSNGSPSSNYSPALSRNSSTQNLQSWNSVSPALAKINQNGRQSSLRIVSPAVRAISPRGPSPALTQQKVHGRVVSPLVTSGLKDKYNRSKVLTPVSKQGTATPRVSPVASQAGPSKARVVNGVHRDSTGFKTTPSTSTQQSNTNTYDNTNKTLAGNKKRRRSDESIGSDASSLKRSRPNGSIPERTKIPKVKTTVQLIAELRAQKSGLAASDTITKIVTNQIVKEQDDIYESIVPAGAKPRPRRKPGTNSINPPDDRMSDLSKTKSELVHRFLQDSNPDNGPGLSHNRSITPELHQHKPIEPPVDPYTLLPPINYDSIIWSDSEDEASSSVKRNPITGEYPDGLDTPDNLYQKETDNQTNLLENWHGVTGTQVADCFHDWTDTISIPNNTDEKTNEQDDVFILPYVDL